MKFVSSPGEVGENYLRYVRCQGGISVQSPARGAINQAEIVRNHCPERLLVAALGVFAKI